jgi:ankyrin repeat protein
VSTESDRPARSLPENPDLRHLKNQAKDLLRAGGAASLTAAQLELARQYGFTSWPKLKAHVESLQEIGRLKEAITKSDFASVRELMTRNPALHRAPLGYNDNGPLTWAAECRGAPPTPERLAIARWMIENGSDVHQGGDGPLMRAALSDDRIAMLQLLVEHGADVNARWDGEYPIVCAPCETLQPRALRWLIEHGADPAAASADYGNCVQMLLCTYWRNPPGKHACLEVFAGAGFPLPDTAPMAIHRGRIDLVQACLDREPANLQRHFSQSEIYPAELGIEPRDGLHCAPLDGGTLLHMAVEYHEVEIAAWLIACGADVNARAAVDADGFGGHTPLFHTTVTLVIKTDEMARLLLQHGADPNARATLRKALRWGGDAEKERMREFHDVTPIGFARQFPEPAWINQSAIAAIIEHGGQ